MSQCCYEDRRRFGAARGDLWNSAFFSRRIRTPRPSLIRTATFTARVTQQILRADQLGFDYAWVAEHHFSNEYGIMPDVLSMPAISRH